jgi:hypothetical protein
LAGKESHDNRKLKLLNAAIEEKKQFLNLQNLRKDKYTTGAKVVPSIMI